MTKHKGGGIRSNEDGQGRERGRTKKNTLEKCFFTHHSFKIKIFIRMEIRYKKVNFFLVYFQFVSLNLKCVVVVFGNPTPSQILNKLLFGGTCSTG